MYSSSRVDDLLLNAAKENNYAKVMNAIDNDANVDAKDSWGNDALHYAVKYRNNLIVRALLDHDANVNSVNSYGETPLMIAIDNFDIRNIQDIYQMGGLVNSRVNLTPLVYVLTSNSPKKYEIADLLLSIYPDSNEQINGRSAVKYLESISRFEEANFLRVRGGF